MSVYDITCAVIRRTLSIILWLNTSPIHTTVETPYGVQRHIIHDYYTLNHEIFNEVTADYDLTQFSCRIIL